jgi:hypothetical protein
MLTTAVAWAIGGSIAVVTAQTSGDASFAAAAKQVRVVYRITPSISTGVEARKAISRFKWTETSDAVKADAILVVVKTFGLQFPLRGSYNSFKELERDADGQMNITGGIVHLYLFVATGEVFREMAHMRYDEEPQSRPVSPFVELVSAKWGCPSIVPLANSFHVFVVSDAMGEILTFLTKSVFPRFHEQTAFAEFGLKIPFTYR